ncbi:hypothetical protein G7Z17_g7217 [Cylindrodendrum hubeiense]|uniref:Uncharacterized protein n=1 Tax=Cylindrodendrum hubeiense TaxID=595255 RepID=A0A9P5HDN4_9HYPO|nr:hypothetical protein G7Z17_g7217 [Cylindrodendrum hubeiense]
MQMSLFEFDPEWILSRARETEGDPNWDYVAVTLGYSEMDDSSIDYQAQDQTAGSPYEPVFSYSPMPLGYNPVPAFGSDGSSPVTTFTPTSSNSSFANSSPSS